MKIITATLLLVISLLGILGTAFLYLGELTQGKGGGYLFILGCFLIQESNPLPGLKSFSEKDKMEKLKNMTIFYLTF